MESDKKQRRILLEFHLANIDSQDIFGAMKLHSTTNRIFSRLPPPRWLQRFCRVLLLLAVIHASGLGLNVTQALAWSGMLVNYSQQFGWEEGSKRTFDGQHPCPLCKAVAAAESRKFSDLAMLSLDEVRLPMLSLNDKNPWGLRGASDCREFIDYHFSVFECPADVLVPPPRLCS